MDRCVHPNCTEPRDGQRLRCFAHHLALFARLVERNKFNVKHHRRAAGQGARKQTPARVGGPSIRAGTGRNPRRVGAFS